MNIRLPVYIEDITREGKSPHYELRPLFLIEPITRSDRINRGLSKLTKQLRRIVEESRHQDSQESLARFTYCPEIEIDTVSFAMKRSNKTLETKWLFVTVKELGRRIAFTPSVPSLSFELRKGDRLAFRAEEMLLRYFREQEKEESGIEPEEVMLKRKGWVTTVDFDAPVIKPPVKFGKADKRVDLMSGADRSGYEELLYTGHCLDWLFPDDLDRAVHRDELVDGLTDILNAKERRPALILGPPKSGKTTLVHELVYRREKKRKPGDELKRQVWHVSPQRLISGMTYVGDWEKRLLNILKEIKEKDHVLYIDDLLGLFLAGQSGSEEFSAALLLKPFVERGDIRLLAEMSPGALRILQEKDRPLTDLFTVFRVDAAEGRELYGMLLTVIRGLERDTGCRFEPEVLKAVIDLQQRYVHDAAFPGKAAEFLRRLANKHADEEVTEQAVLMEFQRTSGLALPFLSQERGLDRIEVMSDLSEKVIGQVAAKEAVANAVTTYHARLNDPQRPIATFLFLGPTGVGKTECAKAVSQVLFADPGRMIRFDMNEYVDAQSVTRLIGDFRNPDGLLTGAIRRQPFAVLLLDEIEKAHPDVFDLLLQVLGEARLTDAQGRTIDFSNAVIILTSNLGSRGAKSAPGYDKSEADERRTYVQAAREFFAPEFINRLDEIVPFETISQDGLRTMARQMIQRLLERHGVQRRRSIVDIEPETINRIADEGANPAWGGRGLKRAVEQQVGWPLARYLAELKRPVPSVLQILSRSDGIALHPQPLIPQAADWRAADDGGLEDPEVILAGVQAFLGRAEMVIGRMAPEGAVDMQAVSTEQALYFALREAIEPAKKNHRDLVRRFGQDPAPRRSGQPLRLRSKKGEFYRVAPELRAGLLEDPEPWSALAQVDWSLVEEADGRRLSLRRLLADCCLLQARLADLGKDSEKDVAIWLRCVQSSGVFGFNRLERHYTEVIESLWGVAPRTSEDPTGIRRESVLIASGAGLEAAFRSEVGSHLFLDRAGAFGLAQVDVFRIPSGAEPEAFLDRFDSVREQWREAFRRGASPLENDPFILKPVVRLYGGEPPDGRTLDLATGLACEGELSAAFLRRVMLSRLALPPELESEVGHE